MHSKVEDLLKEVMRRYGVSKKDLIVIRIDEVPMRIHHLVHELGRRGLVIAEVSVIDGEVYVIALKRYSRDLGLVPEYGISDKVDRK
ncbi:MAG TPA: hypothetical protein ENG05_03565 [Acidilobales archaeon]|nr:hypothetical protein [Acidilobales archaeon]